jgi:hypothetical protein
MVVASFELRSIAIKASILTCSWPEGWFPFYCHALKQIHSAISQLQTGKEARQPLFGS